MHLKLQLLGRNWQLRWLRQIGLAFTEHLGSTLP
jgi:hypothetical protein